MSANVSVSSDKAVAAEELRTALRDGSKLTQTASETTKTNQQHRDLKFILQSRLSRYYSSRSQHWTQENVTSVRSLEILTAREALTVIERIQSIIAIEDDAVVPALGTRDLKQIRTLLSLVFKWGIEPSLNQVKEAWPAKSSTLPAESPSRIINISNLSSDHLFLVQLTRRVLCLILPAGEHSKVPQSLITTTLLGRHLHDILYPALALGWLPKSLSGESMPVINSFRPLVMRLLSIMPASQVITSLGNILSDSSPPPLHVFRACTSLLSRQILRPDGVKGLFDAIFAAEATSGGGIAVEKLEHVSTLLNTVPAKTKPQDYFEHVVPRIIALLSETSSPTCRRAAAFTISRMLRDGDTPLLYSTKRSVIFHLLHDPLLCVCDGLKEYELQELERLPSGTKVHLRPDVILGALLALLPNTDPSPSFVSDLLSPVIPALYSLLYHLNKVKTSDPNLKESLHGMLLTWGKIITGTQGVDTLYSIVKNGQEGKWKIDLEGHIQLLHEAERPTPLSLLTPDQMLETAEIEDPNFDSNIFDLYPDPLHFVKFLKSIDRDDISADLFIRLLEAYHGEKNQLNGDSLRILLYLQITMQMQKQLSDRTSSSILKKPQQMLTFIHHVLELTNSVSLTFQRPERSRLEDKLIVVSSEAEGDTGCDSDDDLPDSEVMGPDNEFVETVINLLLSVLEADEDLSARTMPVLDDIFSLLEPLSKDGSSSVIPLAGEARLVMMARLASTSQPRIPKQKTDQGESPEEIYHKALKLLQDPILPVRAHGLLLLRHLVMPAHLRGKEQGLRAPDPALMPAIMSIFLQSVQDEDSYIFLNSVQGLAAMVDGFGREVLTGLINEYAGKLEELGVNVISQREVDVRTRVGEALGIVIKRCGDALGIYADLIIPPLFNLIRAREIPTVLRTSAISLLADCVNTYSLAVLMFAEDLANAMVDLVQIESVQIQQQISQKHGRVLPEAREKARRSLKQQDTKADEQEFADDDTEKPLETMDSVPTSANTKFPPLRRAALHLLGLLVKEATRHTYESPPSGDSVISQTVMQTAVITLGYISATDADEVVRVMAKEVRESLGDLQNAKLGL